MSEILLPRVGAVRGEVEYPIEPESHKGRFQTVFVAQVRLDNGNAVSQVGKSPLVSRADEARDRVALVHQPSGQVGANEAIGASNQDPRHDLRAMQYWLPSGTHSGNRPRPLLASTCSNQDFARLGRGSKRPR